jgi:hypothetical protein
MKMEGDLFFYGWRHRPWRFKAVVADRPAGEGDLYTPINHILSNLHGQPCDHDYAHDSYTLRLKTDSDYLLDYVEGQSVLLKLKSGQFGFSNVSAYLSMAFERMNGRRISFETLPTGFILRALDGDRVPTRYYPEEGGNLCSVPKGEEKTVCGLGSGPETCVFLMCGGSGFQCGKFSSVASTMLDRLASGTTNAKRVGACRCGGRLKPPTVVG